MKIIPAILAKSYGEFESMVRKIEPYTDLVHLDIADGEFVPNKTIDGYDELKRINTNLNFEVHLMVKNPENIIDRWLKTKAIRYLVHWESPDSQSESRILDSAKRNRDTFRFSVLIDKIKRGGKEIGFVFNPQTDYSMMESYIDRVNLVQFMTVDPGFYGSPFLPEILEKIRNFHSQYPNKKIQVDGGINRDTIILVQKSGGSCAAVGRYIFQMSDVIKALQELNV